MNLKEVKDVYLKGDKEEAVLMLHGFSGNPNQLKQIAKQIHEEGYTVKIPVYEGHGGEAEEILKSTPKKWLKQSKESFEELKKEGYKKIHIAGISIGAVFTLNLAKEKEAGKIILMSTPMTKMSQKETKKRLLKYADVYKHMQGKEEEKILSEIKKIEKEKALKLINEEINEIISSTRKEIKNITKEVLVMQGLEDEKMYLDSADFIMRNLKNSNNKEKK